MLAEILFVISLTAFLLYIAVLLLERHYERRFFASWQDTMDKHTIKLIQISIHAFSQISQFGIINTARKYILLLIKKTLVFLNKLFLFLANIFGAGARKIKVSGTPSEFLKSVSDEKEKIHNSDDKLKEIIEQEQKA